ncbi:MAG TPA: VOC family protein [Candidatus Aquilonibacter sp.]|nr:VOC family protein [Candidatus Aquilonibacter sp.]
MPILGIAPQFLVDDLDAAIAHYVEKLGFALDFLFEGFYASVSRDGFAIHLKDAPKYPGDGEYPKADEHVDAYVSVSGVEALYEEVQSRGANITHPLQEQRWGTRDFYVRDPEGYILCFSERGQ